MIKQEIDKILNQKMSRRQFLKSIGLGLLAIVGLPALIHILMPKTGHQTAVQSGGAGYGNGGYGS